MVLLNPQKLSHTLSRYGSKHDLPNEFKPMIGALAANVGEVIASEPMSNEFLGIFSELGSGVM
jgi:3-deoxy-D-manno-octulosonic-acid transferase